MNSIIGAWRGFVKKKYYLQTCGVMGMPECDKVPLPKGFEAAMKKHGEKNEVPVGFENIGIGK